MTTTTTISTNKLTGAALDWAVAKCESRELLMQPNRMGTLSFDAGLHPYMADLEKTGRWQVYAPSANWAQGGPIIEREGITIDCIQCDGWIATLPMICEAKYEESSPTPLVAAMRCYVASKLGDTVEVPTNLI